MSVSATSVAGDGAGGKTVMAEMPVVLQPGSGGSREKQKTPQKRVDEFWKKFSTKAPGKATTVLPKNELAQKLAKRKSAKEVGSGITAQASYEEAAALCRAKVEKIVQECRRVNQKYRDPHFDLEQDLKSGYRDCLESLSNLRYDSSDDDDDSDSSFGSIRPRPRPCRGTSEFKQRKSRRSDGVANEDGGPAADSPQGRQPGSRFCPKSVKRVEEIFDDPKFYIDGPTANDVRQGRDGDCWLMAALCTLSNKPGLIEKICVANNPNVGVYGFVFHRDGEWVSEIIDDKLYLTKPDYDEAISGGINMERVLWEDRERPDSEEVYRKTYQSNNGALYFAQCEHPNETWLPLLEKAYAKAHGDYAAIEGGFTGEGIEDLTGGVTSGLFTTDILDKEYFWKEELMKVNQQFLFGCSTGLWGRGWGHRKGIMEGHAYSVMRAVEMDGERLLLLKNPWGKGEWTGPWSDGSKEWTPEWLQKLGHRFGDDGAFWISYKDLLRKYQAFDRTRLFGPDWKITAIWTTLSVPWTLEYHDTKFVFTLAKAGPVVLVLSQLDDRYFRGLEGPYKFGLGMRVHKAGEDDYLVRAQSAYRMTRSINVELDLEAGEYIVLVKLDARRLDHIKPVEDVVRENAKDRREKLIRIGLAYDLAHSKAKIIETPDEKAAREAYEKRKKDKQRERIRKMIQEEKERRYYQNVKGLNKQRKRIERRKERRKAKAEKKKAEAEQREKEARETEGKELEKREAVMRERMMMREATEREAAKRAGGGKSTSPSKVSSTTEVGKDQDTEPKINLKPDQDNQDQGAVTEKDDSIKGAKTPQTGSEQSSSTVGKNTPTASTLGETPGNEDGASQVNKEADTESDKQDTETSAVEQPDAPAAPSEPTKQEIEPSPPPAGFSEGGKSGKATDAGDVKDVKGEKTAENGHDSKEDVNKKQQQISAQVEDKIRHAIGVFTDLKEELEAMLPDDSSSDEQQLQPQRGPGYPQPTRSGGRIPSSPPRLPHPMLHRPSPPLGPGWRTPPDIPMNMMMGGGPPRPPPPGRGGGGPGSGPGGPRSEVSYDDDRDGLSSITTVSELSERELDFHVKDRVRIAAMPRGPPPPMGPQPRIGGSAPGLEEDEFEKDPWNAVAVVGLRVYYKAAEEEGAEKEQKQTVALRVVRPNPYELSDVDDEKDDDKAAAGSEKEDKDQKDDEKEGEGEEIDETKVLDVDDSAKDHTSQPVVA
ncbi:calcium-dependent cysteine-type endopeptidase-like protein [Apodospora peruviana]|uniref:Calcium-dependent cysteine-type endopeptidase-like protein n=1 Tax=Apodospora peruviana TaxID=516989 RepID=A0AAE0IIR9_9PEZI|nr:calcium-dependent cysteine-type endopeptidase-like protein [Apodospora peruviana]